MIKCIFLISLLHCYLAVGMLNKQELVQMYGQEKIDALEGFFTTFDDSMPWQVRLKIEVVKHLMKVSDICKDNEMKLFLHSTISEMYRIVAPSRLHKIK